MKLLVLVLLFCGVCLGSYAQNYIENVTPQIVIEKAVEAMGGKEYLQSINSIYTRSKMKSGGKEYTVETKELKPNKGLFRVTDSNKVVFASWFDGKRGHYANAGTKNRVDRNLYKDKIYKKNLFDELDYLDSTLWKLELTGHEDVANEDCYQIKATLKNGSVYLLCYSSKSFLLMKSEELIVSVGRSYTKHYYSNYKQFGKLTYSATTALVTGDRTQVINIQELLINEKVDEMDFK